MRSVSRLLKKTIKNTILLFIIIYQKTIHVLFPVDKYKVCYLPVGLSMSGNAHELLNLWKKNNKYKHVYIVKEKLEKNCKINIYYNLGLLSLFHYSTAKFVIREVEFSSFGFISRPESIVIQLWHAAGAFKKMSVDVKSSCFIMLNRKRDISTWNMLLCSSEEVKKIYSSAFNSYPLEKIYVSGLPRNDYLFRLAMGVESPSSFYKIDRAKKIILFAPTFRDRASAEDEHLIVSLVKYLYENISSKYVLAVRLHPSMQNLSFHFNALDFNVMHAEEALYLSDYLITDYSSIIFDYALLGRPILFYVPDFDKYYDKRGFYFEYEKFVPGPIYKNKEDLLVGIVDYDINEWKDKIAFFADKYNPFFDGKNTERILNKILSLI